MTERRAQPVVVDVVRAALFCLGDSAKSPKTAGAWKPLVSLLERAGRSPQDALEDALDILQTRGHTELARGEAPRLTEHGRTAASEWVGVRKPPPRSGWPFLLNQVLPARALGHSVQELHKKKDRADWLRAEVVRQHFSLSLEPWSSPRTVRDGVAWLLLGKGARPEVVARAQGKSRAFAAGPVIGVLVSTYLGLPTALALESVLTALAQRAAGAGALDAAALTSALGVHLLKSAGRVFSEREEGAALAHVPDGEGGAVTSNGGPGIPTPGDLTDFAAKVVQAARRSKDGWLGDGMVFVSHAFQMFQASGTSISLDAFKRALLEAHRAGLVTLAGADMPQTLPAADLHESVVRYGTTTFYFIRV